MTRLRTRYTQRLPTAPGLRLDVPFFEGSGSKALDLSGKGNHGSLTDVTWSRSEKGVCGSFNGSSSFGDCGNDASLNITDAITIEAWVKPNDFASNNYLFAKRTSTDFQWGFLLAWSILSVKWYDGAWKTRSTGGGTISATGWQHVVFTWNGATFLMYIDAISKTNTGDSITFQSYPSSSLKIGQDGVNTSGRFFNGTIDEARIYNRALSAEAQKRRYEQPWYDYVRGG